ncbi:hypothetical protein [Weissella cibaria]|uniref:hypothetical protein n=1 Tax=Weissella cibaria TaxID=137591 RepID=UPI001C1FB4C7|nr:hypothetical protein [Weissella cibaria]MBU7545488.1 hypothetical protein [Weissella cibaria]MCV3318754.1 hypothetical protein [Weissella cibaria]
MRKFDSKAQLAKEIGITRATLYRRANRLSINIEDLAEQGITEEDYQALTVDQSIGSVSSNAQQAKELARVQAELERLRADNERIERERLSVQNDKERLEKELMSVSDERDTLNTKYIEALEDAKVYADKFAQLADQSQRLQAQSQLQIDSEASKKGFWSRLFNK